MIYENYNRPPLVRLIEYIKFFISGTASLGIMQITSEKFINNNESVKLGYKMIRDTYYSINKKVKLEKRLKKVIFMYNKSNKYIEEVLSIYYLLNDEI